MLSVFADQDRIIRRQEKSLEMIWSASPSYGPSNYVFANTLINDAYSPPPGYGLCWDQSCNGEDIQDDPSQPRATHITTTARDHQPQPITFTVTKLTPSVLTVDALLGVACLCVRVVRVGG